MRLLLDLGSSQLVSNNSAGIHEIMDGSSLHKKSHEDSKIDFDSQMGFLYCLHYENEKLSPRKL